MKLLFYPVFETESDLADYIYRAAWYLYPLADRLTEVTFVFKGNISIDQMPKPGPEMACDLFEISKKFTKIKIKNSGSFNLHDAIYASDFIFIHKDETRNVLTRNFPDLHAKKIIRVDKNAVQYADSLFLRFFENFPADREQCTELAKTRCQTFLAPLRREKCYVFGTGPNFAHVEGFDFSDGLVVACNSIAANAEILEQLNPDIFVIADPIFHAGPSSYAYSFRKSLEDQLIKRSCPLVVPLRDYHLYRVYLHKSLQDRIIPVDFAAGDSPRLNILDSPTVTTTSNVLTLFQIPLAASLAQEINISGCDGRPLKENSYFWSHNKKVQINDKMDDIKRAHPAFFNISYDDYYNKHISTVETWAQACEVSGINIINLTPSYIPALQCRQSAKLLPHVKKMASRNGFNPRVSVIIPAYNCADYLSEAVSSLLNEGRDDLEIIIVDDFSDDQSLTVAKDLAVVHSEIRVVQNFHGKGVSGARNTGIDIACGEFIGFLDSDDSIPPGSLNARIAILEENPQVHIVHSHCRMINAEGADLGVQLFEHRDISFDQMSGSGSTFNTIVIRASELGRTLRFDEGLANGEDWLAFARLLRLGYISKYVADGWANYRVHAESTVLKDFSGHEKALLDVINWICTPAKKSESAEKYSAGLAHPRQEKIVADRRISQLLFYVLVGDTTRIEALLERADLREQIAATKGAWINRIRIPAVRVTSLHIDRLNEAPEPILVRVLEGLNCLRHWPQTGKLIEAIEHLFGFRITTSLADAGHPVSLPPRMPTVQSDAERLRPVMLRLSAQILLDPGRISLRRAFDTDHGQTFMRLLKTQDAVAMHCEKVCVWARERRTG